MAFPKWFNEVEYLEAKRDLLNANAGANGHRYASILEVSDAIKAAGMNAFEHYNTFGSKEGLNPSKIFNAYEYCSFKLKALQADAATKGEWATKSWQDVQLAIHNSGMSLGDHYTMFGTVEGISMSNAFDTTAYLTAKLELLKANEATKGEWATKTVTDVANAIKAIGMDAYTHYMTFKGGANEVDPSQSFASKDPVGGGDSNTFLLNRNPNNVVGTTGNDIIIGETGQLHVTDTIDGGAGKDELRLYNASTGDLGNLNIASIKNVEVVKAIGAGATATAIDVSGLKDVQEVWNVKSSYLEDFTVTEGQAVGLEGTQAAAATIDVKGTDGSANALNLMLKDASIGTSLTIDNGGTGGLVTVEKLNIAASGANAVAAIADASLKTLIITGTEGSFKLDDGTSDLAALETIDASGYAGDVNIGSGTGISEDVTTTYKGGSGADKIYITDNFASAAAAAKYDGGADVDTLVIDTEIDFGATEAGFINKTTNWEVLEMSAAAHTLAAGSLYMNGFVFSGANATASGGNFATITGIESNDSFAFAATYGTATAATSNTDGANGISLVGKDKFQDFNLELLKSANIIGQDGTGATANDGQDGGHGITTGRFETLTITSNGTKHSIEGGDGTVAANSGINGKGGHGINNADKIVIIEGNAELTIKGGNGASGGGSTTGADVHGSSFANAVDLVATDFSGKLITGGSIDSDKMTLGSGGSEITATTGADEITFGTGVDKLIGFVKADTNAVNITTIHKFETGSDKFVYAAGNKNQAKTGDVAFVEHNASTGEDLTTVLTDALGGAGGTLGTKKFGVVDVTGGDDAVNGLYVIYNTGDGFSVAADGIVKLTGVDALTLADFVVA